MWWCLSISQSQPPFLTRVGKCALTPLRKDTSTIDSLRKTFYGECIYCNSLNRSKMPRGRGMDQTSGRPLSWPYCTFPLLKVNQQGDLLGNTKGIPLVVIKF